MLLELSYWLNYYYLEMSILETARWSKGIDNVISSRNKVCTQVLEKKLE